MLANSYPYYLANEPVAANQGLIVTDKHTRETATKVELADSAAIDRAIADSVQAAEPMGHMPPYERQNVLNHCVARSSERSEELAMSLCIEAGTAVPKTAVLDGKEFDSRWNT